MLFSCWIPKWCGRLEKRRGKPSSCFLFIRFSLIVVLCEKVVIPSSTLAQRGTLLEEIEASSKQGRCMDEHRILTLFLSVCRGLDAMHTSGLVHRDIKASAASRSQLPFTPTTIPYQPGNLLLTDDGQELVLMDLGSAGEAEVTITNRWVM